MKTIAINNITREDKELFDEIFTFALNYALDLASKAETEEDEKQILETKNKFYELWKRVSYRVEE